ncbi:MAG: polyphenol oxidase family protein [candidate division WOR-3 bacterium]|nr:MAG: polyphenol oxidase family protein [candidate division WOR-3 bacterium]
MTANNANIPYATHWRLIENNGVTYFQFMWQNHVALYSTKIGNKRFLERFKPLFLKQIHSDIIIDMDHKHADSGDGLLSKNKNDRLGIKIADCLPVYIFSGESMCILHCGWRSIIKGITKRAAELFGNFNYALGASIGPCCYEVQDDVVTLFNEKYNNVIIQRDKKYFLDLKACVIEDLGTENLIGSLALCTKCNPKYFFSHRRGDRKKRNYGVITKV